MYDRLLGGMVVLGSVDGSNDGMGRQKAPRIQEGVWERVSPSEESHDTIFVLNLWAADDTQCHLGPPSVNIRVLRKYSYLDNTFVGDWYLLGPL